MSRQGVCTQWTVSLATDDGAHGGFCTRQTLVPPNPSPAAPPFQKEPPPQEGQSCPLSRGAVFCVGFRGGGGSVALVAVTHINTFYSLKYYLCSTCCFAISFFFFWVMFSIGFLFKYMLHILLCLSMRFPVFFVCVF